MCQPPGNPLPAPSLTTSKETALISAEFSSDERLVLLSLAHASICAALEQRDLKLEPPNTHLAQPRGVFTTLYLRTRLRGCVGYIYPVSSVYQTVAETARAAAFEDTRFFPVTAEEAPELKIHLSILSVLEPIQPDQVQVGQHGLLVSMAGRRGLLLPQVATENDWDRITFLEQTCCKAGLSPDAWRKGATLEAFTAEIFGDEDFHGNS